VLLIYNHRTDRYEGEQLAVSVAAMEDAVAELLEGGMTDGEARAELIDEGAWSVDMAGVTVLVAHPALGQLAYDPIHDRYVGAQLAVDGAAFRACVAHFLDDGTGELDTLAVLLREAAWSAAMDGVIQLPDAGGAVREAERLLRPDAEL